MPMKINENTSDRIVRLLLGIVFGYLGLIEATSTFAQIILFVLGGALLITGLAGFSAIYSLFGLNTHTPPDNSNI